MSTMSSDTLLSTLNAKAAAVSQSIDSGVSQISSNAQDLQDSFSTQEKLARANSDSAGVITSVQQFGQKAVEDSLARNAVNLGGDLGDATGLQSDLASKYLSARSDQQNALAEINKKQAISFFDDPLGWIGAQFSINDDITKHNSAAATADEAASQIQQTNELLTTRAIAANTLRQTVTQASAQAAIETAKNNALVAAETYRQQGISANTKSIQEVVQLRSADMAAVATSYDASVKQAQLGIAQQHLSLAVQEESRRVQEFEWKKENEEEKKSVGTYLQDNIIRGYKALFPDHPDKWEAPNSPKILSLISGKVPLDGELKAAFEAGVLNSKIDPDSSNDTRILATSPFELSKILPYSPDLGVGAKQTAGIITNALKDIQQSSAYKQFVQNKDLPGATSLVNDTVQGIFKGYSNKISGPDNPYWLPNITELAKQSPGIKDFGLYSKVIAPLAAAGVDTSDPGVVLNQSIQAVRDGKIGLNQMAVDFSAMYRQGQAVNIKSKQFINLGITPAESYNISIDTGQVFNRTVNLADPSEVMKVALRRLINTGDSKLYMNQTQMPGIRDLTGSEATAAREKAMFYPNFNPTSTGP